MVLALCAAAFGIAARARAADTQLAANLPSASAGDLNIQSAAPQSATADPPAPVAEKLTIETGRAVDGAFYLVGRDARQQLLIDRLEADGKLVDA